MQVKAARAGNLPVERLVKLPLAVDLGTAKALGINLPASLRAGRRRHPLARC